jgi:hypothetical protein
MSINIFMEQFVPTHLKHQYGLYDRGPKTGIGYSCNFPSRVLTVDTKGYCFLCKCDGWLPVSVGHIMDFDSLEAVWQNDIARQLQKDLAEKKFTYCSVDSCNIKKSDIHEEVHFISLNFDDSCNLACPTCRKSKINITTGPEYETRLSWANHLVKLLSKFELPCNINMSGNGDPFASLIYRQLIMNVSPKPNHKYHIMTNGLLLKKLLPQTKIYENIVNFDISIDAGDKITYEKVRRGGQWETLIENLDFLKSLNREWTVNLNMVVQVENFNSIPNFCNLVDRYGWQGRLSKLENWNTFTEKDWQFQNVLNPAHPAHPRLLQMLAQAQRPSIFVGNLLQ